MNFSLIGFCSSQCPVKLNLKLTITRDRVIKNGPSKICGRQPLKNMK